MSELQLTIKDLEARLSRLQVVLFLPASLPPCLPASLPPCLPFSLPQLPPCLPCALPRLSPHLPKNANPPTRKNTAPSALHAHRPLHLLRSITVFDPRGFAPERRRPREGVEEQLCEGCQCLGLVAGGGSGRVKLELMRGRSRRGGARGGAAEISEEEEEEGTGEGGRGGELYHQEGACAASVYSPGFRA
jgi:hypothetical protein